MLYALNSVVKRFHELHRNHTIVCHKNSSQQLTADDLTLQNHMNHENHGRSQEVKTTEMWSYRV